LTEPAPAGFARAGRAGAALGAVRIAARGQTRGRLHQAREHRRFGDPHFPRRLSEIALRGGLDPIGAGAEIDAIEIKLENLRLAESAFEPERKHDFLHLAPERALLGEKQVLGELLGDRRAALRHAAAKHVGRRGAHEPEGIDAVMAEEAPVLDRDERLRQIGRKLLDRHISTAHLAARDERPSIGADDLDRRRALGDFK
jgi:hypothetical protein